MPDTDTDTQPTIPGTDVPAAPAPADKAPAPDKPKRKRAPRKAADKAPAAPRGPGRPSKDDQLENALRELIELAAGAGVVVTARVGLFGAPDGSVSPMPQVGAPGSVSADFVIVQNHAPQLAHALMSVAKANPSFRRWIERATTGGAYSELTIVVLSIAGAIIANHGILPGFGPESTDDGAPPAPQL